jgi:hypothetical protein
MTASTMTKKTARKAKSVSKAALGRYLAAGLGATGLATAESEAAIVNLNISALGTPAQNRSGVNAGLAPGVFTNVFNTVPTSVTGGVTNAIGVWNNFTTGERGLTPFTATEFLTGSVYTSPTNLTDGTLVGATAPLGSQWSTDSNGSNALFAYNPGTLYESPNFGPGSFIGFRVQRASPSGYNYGYFRVTWDNVTNDFQILSGAYESTPNTPIAVPEPATMALAGIGALALGAGAIRRSRKARKAAAEGTLAEAV